MPVFALIPPVKIRDCEQATQKAGKDGLMPEQVSTGLTGLDAILNQLRKGNARSGPCLKTK